MICVFNIALIHRSTVVFQSFLAPSNSIAVNMVITAAFSVRLICENWKSRHCIINCVIKIVFCFIDLSRWNSQSHCSHSLFSLCIQLMMTTNRERRKYHRNVAAHSISLNVCRSSINYQFYKCTNCVVDSFILIRKFMAVHWLIDGWYLNEFGIIRSIWCKNKLKHLTFVQTLISLPYIKSW